MQSSKAIDAFFDSQNPIEIINHAKVYKTSLDLNVRQIDSLVLTNAIKEGKQRESQGFSEDFFWVRFSINWQHTSPSTILEVNNPHIDRIELFKKENGNFTLLGIGGDRHMDFYARTQINRRYIFNLDPERGVTTYYLKIDKRKASVSFPLFLWEKQAFQIQETQTTMYHGMFFGFLALVFVLSLVLSLIFKNKLFGLYALYTFCMALYLFTTLGYAFQYLYPQHPNLNNYSRVILMIALSISGSSFLIRFLNMRKHSTFIYKAYRVGNIYLLALMLGWLVFQGLYRELTIYFLQMAYLVFALYFTMAFIAAARNYRHDKINSLLFFTAFGLAILGASCYVLIELGWLSEGLFPLNPVLMGSGLEIVVLTTGLTYHIKRLFKQNKQVNNELRSLKKIIQSLIQKQARLVKQMSENSTKTTIKLKSKALINTKDILYIASDGHYVDYFTNNKKRPEVDRDTLKSVLRRLPTENFMQIHRKYIVNINAIKRISSKNVTLINGIELNISRTYKSALKDRFKNA